MKNPKVLLLTSPAPSKRVYGFSLKEKRFPLGLGYLASVLRSNHIDVTIMDLYAKNRDVDFSSYDFIGVYSNTICFNRGTLPLLTKINDSKFNGKIVVGGPHACLLPKTIPDFVDHVVQGEGEYALLSIVKGEETSRGVVSPRIQELDVLPFPSYDLYDLSLYNLSFEEDKTVKKVFTYSSSRGCPFNCSFCSSKNIYNRKWTAHSPNRMVEDVVCLQQDYGIDGIYFREDNFTVSIKRVEEFCNLIIKKGIDIKWKCETRVDVSFKTLTLMKRAGCAIVYVGFESGSPRMLEVMKKKIDIEQSISFVDSCKNLGIKVYGSFVSYMPHEEEVDRQLTKAFIAKLNLDKVCENKYLAMPGSELYDEIVRNPQMAKRYKTKIIRF